MSTIDSSKFDTDVQGDDLNSDDLVTQFDNAKTDIEALETTVGDITVAEADQIENIGTVTISNTQWGHVGAMDQGVATTDSPEFVEVIGNPEHATDGGTDAYDSATTTSQPGTGKTITRDFQSANTTTTPTLDTVTIKSRDGSALWAGAIDGVHDLEYDGTDYLLLDPELSTADATITGQWTFNDDVGIGIATPDGTLHVHTASAGAATSSSSGDDLVVENSGNVGISVLSSNTSIGSLFFGDPEAAAQGQVRYDHSDDSMSFSASNSEAMRITSDGGIITPNATGGSQGADTINASGLFVDGVSSARIATGTYTGDGTTSQAITGLGFQPVYVRIFTEVGNGVDGTIYETTDTFVTVDASGFSYEQSESSGTAVIRALDDRLISLDSDGFTVDDDGGDNRPNKDGETYHYMAVG